MKLCHNLTNGYFTHPIPRYDGRSKWYAGSVTAINDDGSIDIVYEKGMWNGWVSFTPNAENEGSLIRPQINPTFDLCSTTGVYIRVRGKTRTFPTCEWPGSRDSSSRAIGYAGVARKCEPCQETAGHATPTSRRHG